MDRVSTKSEDFLSLDFKSHLKACLSPSRHKSWLEAELGLGLQGAVGWEIFQIYKLLFSIICHLLTLHVWKSSSRKLLVASSYLFCPTLRQATLMLNLHSSWASGCGWGCDPSMALRKPVEQDQKGPWATGAFLPPPELCNWIHNIDPFPSPESKTSGSFLASSICPLTSPCCPSVWPMQRQQVPNCIEKSFSFSEQNKNLRHWTFHSRASAHKVSRPLELPIIQLSSNHLKASLNNIPSPNSAEFTSHYPSASAVLSPLALLTCMHFGGEKVWHSSWSISQESLVWFVTPFRNVTKHYNFQTPERARQAFICLGRVQIEPVPPKCFWIGQKR